MKYFILAGLAALTFAGAGIAQQPVREVVVTVSRVPASSGAQMYASYCATCHGLNAKGNGPMASGLSRQPADLTALSRMNGGIFPSEHVLAVLEFGATKSVRHATGMPVWGPILNGMDTAYPGQSLGVVRMVNLSRYLKTIQK